VPDLAFDLRYLKYAMLAAEHGSFRRAAEILNLSQSTVSRRIQLLERRIGIPLFERTRSGARPTAAGERFMREAAVGAGQLREAVNSISMAREVAIARLRRPHRRPLRQPPGFAPASRRGRSSGSEGAQRRIPACR
jgi:DNA-binding transcriptional LysR family regulator